MITKPSNMRLPKDVLKNIKDIQNKLNVNKTKATALSIKIAHTILNRIDKDGSIDIVRSDGTTERIHFLL